MGFIDELAGNTATGLAAQGASAIVGSITSALDGGHSARKQARYQQELDKQMALWNKENITDPNFQMENEEWTRRFQEQNAQWEKQFNMQNEYNSPYEQVQRLREAGINPAGLNANGAAGMANQGQGSDVAAPYTPQAAGYPAQTPNYLEALDVENRRTLNEAQISKISNEAVNEAIHNKWAEAVITGNLEEQGVRIQLGKIEGKLRHAQAKEAKANEKYLLQRAINAKKELDVMQKEIEKVDAQMAEIAQRIQASQTNEDYQKTLMHEIDAKLPYLIKQIQAQTNKDYKESEVLARTALNLIKQGEKLEYENFNAAADQAIRKSNLNTEAAVTWGEWQYKNSKLQLNDDKVNWMQREEIYRKDWELNRFTQERNNRLKVWDEAVNVTNAVTGIWHVGGGGGGQGAAGQDIHFDTTNSYGMETNYR